MEYKSRPLQYFAHLFGHEGENSILSYLTKKGYALNLSASEDHELDIYSTFCIKIGLTKEGIENYEEVLMSVF
jgi:insulysin